MLGSVSLIYHRLTVFSGNSKSADPCGHGGSTPPPGTIHHHLLNIVNEAICRDVESRHSSSVRTSECEEDWGNTLQARAEYEPHLADMSSWPGEKR
jgi:hypothetical protein